MVNNNAIFEISGEKVLITTILSGEIKKTILSLNDFITSVKSIEQTLNTELFCTNTVRYGSNSSGTILTLFSPQCKMNIKARITSNGVTEFENVLFPSFLMDCHFDQNRRFIKSYIKMVPNKYTSMELDNNPITYFLPFPNIYSDNKICWGSAVNGITITLTNANLLLDIFKTSVFNQDLFSEPLRLISDRNKEVTDIASYYNFLTTLEEWPESLCFNFNDRFGPNELAI